MIFFILLLCIHTTRIQQNEDNQISIVNPKDIVDITTINLEETVDIPPLKSIYGDDIYTICKDMKKFIQEDHPTLYMEMKIQELFYKKEDTENDILLLNERYCNKEDFNFLNNDIKVNNLYMKDNYYMTKDGNFLNNDIKGNNLYMKDNYYMTKDGKVLLVL